MDAVAKGRRFLTDRSYRVLIGICAAALAGFGLWFAWSGVRALLGLPG